MLKIRATQSTGYEDEGYVNYDQVVGYFPIDDSLPPFEPQRSQLVVGEYGLNAKPDATEAWVSHDGQGQVDGFPLSRAWEEESKKPEAFFYPPEDYQYLLVEDSDCYVSI